MLLSLPEELVIAVLEHTDFSSLIRCKLVCHALNELVSTSSPLKYKRTLWQQGYWDFPTTETVTIPERQARLERLVRGWKDPQWSWMTKVPLFREGTTYELQGGIFVSGRPSFEDYRSTRGLLFWELPWRDYAAEGQPVRQTGSHGQSTWEIPDLGVNVHDFQIDPAQDLLVLVAKGKPNTGEGANVITVHIRNMSDGIAHPETEAPLKHIELHQTPKGHRLVVIGFIIQVVDDILAILTCFRSFNAEAPPPFDVVLGRSRVDVFNWKTGATYACIEDDGVDSIVFLDEETIMLVRRVGDITPKTISLDVFKYSLSTSVQPPTSRTSQYPLPPLGARPIARLFLPSMPDEPGVITHVIARCEPTPSYRKTPTQRPRQMQSPAPTNRPAQSARLVSLTFVTLQPHFPPLERPFVFLFFAETIRELATQYGSGTFTQMQWESWGPQNTRILERSAPSQWICYTYGSKFAYLDTATEDVVTILDFNPAAVRTGDDVEVKTLVSGRISKKWKTEYNRGVYVNTSRDVAALGSWTSDTSSALPYVRFQSTTAFQNATSVMIDHERVIVATREFYGDAFVVFNV